MNSSNATSTSAYPSSKTWGLFNGTACFTGPRPPGRGVDMFRNTWCASVKTELSNAPAAWTCDSRETPSHSETKVPDSSASQSSIPVTGSEPPRGGSPQRGPGVIFFCQCPRLLPFNTHGLADGRLAREGICLLMTD